MSHKIKKSGDLSARKPFVTTGLLISSAGMFFSAFITNVKISAKQTHTSTLFDAVMLWQPAGFTRTLISMIISLLGRNDILLSRWKTPASPAYFKPQRLHPLYAHTLHCPRAFSATFEVHLFFHPKKKKREKTTVNWNLLSLQDISPIAA